MKAIIFLLIAAVLVGGFALYGLFGGSGPANKIETDAVVEVTEEFDTAEEQHVFRGKGNLLEVQKLGVNLECSISYNALDMSEPLVGTYFVSRERIRGDFEMIAPELGDNIVSSMIFKDNMFYSWSVIDGDAYGVKVGGSFTDGLDNEMVKSPVPSDARVTYDCKEWKEIDGSIFEPSNEVLFKDMSKASDSEMEYGTIYGEGEF